MRAYHFLSERWALEALFKKRLKISTIDDLNDPFELLNFEILDEAIHNFWLRQMKVLSNLYGVICFSKDWCNPLLWSHYANKHKGICLGFDISGGLESEINYRTGRMPWSEVKSLFNIKNPDSESKERIMRTILLTKYEDWKYEEEVRVFTDLKDSEGGRYFKDFSNDMLLKEIILGARCKIDKKRIIECLKGDVEVIEAELDNRTFKVVKRNNAV